MLRRVATVVGLVGILGDRDDAVAMEAAHRASAEQLRSLISNGQATPAELRAALRQVHPTDRDAWLNVAFGLDELPDDGPELPRGGVPFVPCSVNTLLRLVEEACVQSSDVFVDVGSGVGRAAALVHLLTGAPAIGVEIQPALVRASRDLATRLRLPHLSFVEGDAAALSGAIANGSVFFLYCPFGGERLKQVLEALERIARRTPIRVCCVDLPLPPCPWLTLVSPPRAEVAVYRSQRAMRST